MFTFDGPIIIFTLTETGFQIIVIMKNQKKNSCLDDDLSVTKDKAV